jgi:hypothetical protein
MLPGLSERTVLPTSEDVERALPLRAVSTTPVGRAATGGGQLAGGFYYGPGSPLRVLAELPGGVARAGGEFLRSGVPAHVVKPKGGNWLAGSVERVIEPMKARDRFGMTDPRDLAAAIGVPLEEAQALHASNLPNVAINRWLDTKLAKYFRNEMGTPEDPLRALAERGVLHYEPQGGAVRAHSNRTVAEMPTDPTATSPLARAWEDISDAAVLSGSYAEHTPLGGFSEEALRKLGGEYAVKNPQATAYKMDSGITASDLGFSHLVDELKNAINPASGLPENLRWKYSDLDKVTVPQAVERVAKINEWRAAQKAEADAARAMNPATVVHKEYPGQPYKWVELKKPDFMDPKVLEALAGYEKDPRFKASLGDNLKNRAPKLALEDALKYEGDVMGHCVGGYCPDVESGRSRIFSLRSAKGEPHVTIEVKPTPQRDLNMSAAQYDKLLADYSSAVGRGEVDPNVLDPKSWYLAQGEAAPPSIVQIKGKANRAPKEEYLPYVQDFVKSQRWSDVGDFSNTGLKNLRDLGDEPMIMQAREKFGDYVTPEEWESIMNPRPGFAAGGLVVPDDMNYNPARVEEIANSLREELNAQ